MNLKKAKEYQTVRLFAILGLMTLLIVMLFKVVLFAPQNQEGLRLPAQNMYVQPGVNSGMIMPNGTTK